MAGTSRDLQLRARTVYKLSASYQDPRYASFYGLCSLQLITRGHKGALDTSRAGSCLCVKVHKRCWQCYCSRLRFGLLSSRTLLPPSLFPANFWLSVLTVVQISPKRKSWYNTSELSIHQMVKPAQKKHVTDSERCNHLTVFFTSNFYWQNLNICSSEESVCPPQL